MGRKRESDAKCDALRRKGALNRKPETVSDARFAEDEFFDARDLVQVKYEMLRRVRAEDWSVTEAATAFGMSRFSFYEAKGALERDGLPGLVPKKPGPRGRHKMTAEVVAFVRSELANDASLSIGDLPALVKERFGLVVHRRTIERALEGPRKKGL
jgi:transposase